MSAIPPLHPLQETNPSALDRKNAEALEHDHSSSDREEDSIDLHKEIYDSSAVDPVLAKKMALVNNAIDEVGMTKLQWKLFFLNGFGYAVDSVSSCQASSPSPARKLIWRLSAASYCLPIDLAACSHTRVWQP